MKRLLTITVITLTLTFFSFHFAFSEVPHLINYQGRLTDSQDKALPDGSYSVTFRIYDAKGAGSLLWEETQSVITNKGVFNVLLGSVANLNLPFDNPYWLEIKVGQEVMTPRQQIASAGYAFRAETVTNYTLPFYRSGCGVERVDSNHIKVTPGVIDIGGTMLSAANYSTNMAINTGSNYIEGSAVSSNSWVYVYVYNNNGSLGYKFSKNPPSKADHNGGVAGVKRYYASGGYNYRCIGWFYNDSSGNVDEVGNIREDDAANIVEVTGITNISYSSGSYTDMDGMEIHFVSSGRPVLVLFDASIWTTNSGGEGGRFRLNIDGSIKKTAYWGHKDGSYGLDAPIVINHMETLSAGQHTIKIQWFCNNGRVYQNGASRERTLIVMEL